MYRRRSAGDSVSKNKEEWRRAARVAGWDHRRVRVVRGCTALRWHGAREGDSPPLVTAAKRQDFPHRVHREMGADPCPQTEAGPTPPPEWCGGTRRHEVGRAERPHSVAKIDTRLKCDKNVNDDRWIGHLNIRVHSDYDSWIYSCQSARAMIYEILQLCRL